MGAGAGGAGGAAGGGATGTTGGGVPSHDITGSDKARAVRAVRAVRGIDMAAAIARESRRASTPDRWPRGGPEPGLLSPGRPRASPSRVGGPAPASRPLTNLALAEGFRHRSLARELSLCQGGGPMFDTVSLKKRAANSLRPTAELAPGSPGPVERVKRRLSDMQCAHLRARAYGQHILIEPENGAPRSKDRDAIARLTDLGGDVYGLAFRKTHGGWEPIVLIDTLDELVWEMVAAMTPDPPAVSEVRGVAAVDGDFGDLFDLADCA